MSSPAGENWVADCVVRHASDGLLVDANVLLLLFVGAYDRALIPKFKRTQVFAEEDYDLLVDFAGRFARIRTTCHVMAEVSNLSWGLPRQMIADYAEHFIQVTHTLTEHQKLAVELVTHYAFPKLGLTDAYLALLASDHLLLTDDWPLSGFVEGSGGHVINFNHLRSYGRA